MVVALLCCCNGDPSDWSLLHRTAPRLLHAPDSLTRDPPVFATIVPYSLAISQLVRKAHVHLENEIACISLNPPSNQPTSVADTVTTAMECEEGSKLDALVAVGMWTDMTVSLAIRVVLGPDACRLWSRGSARTIVVLPSYGVRCFDINALSALIYLKLKQLLA